MTDLEQQTLYALFCLSRDNRRISASTLADALSSGGITPTCAAAALVALERAGLVDASRARLTMLGLATAVRRGQAAGGPRLDLRPKAAAPPRAVERLPVAARANDADSPDYLVGGDGSVPSPLA